MDFKEKKALVLGVILYHRGRTLEQLRETFVSKETMTEEELQKCLKALQQEGRIKEQSETQSSQDKQLAFA